MRRPSPARALALQAGPGGADRLWELADAFALRDDHRAEDEYRAAARLREKLDAHRAPPPDGGT